MGMNETPKGERIQIALFGRRNSGKSSIINAITEQEIAIVSDIKGTTTDPVYKAMELLPLGSVMLVDTPGLDDEGELGIQRVKRAEQVLAYTDIALLIIDIRVGIAKPDLDLLQVLKKKKLAYIIVLNKIDALKKPASIRVYLNQVGLGVNEQNIIAVSAKTGEGIWELKELLTRQLPEEEEKIRIVGDLIEPSDLVVLVVPIDTAAPKGRLILPQQQTIRDILESDAMVIVTKEDQLRETLMNLKKKPKLVITDSQVFEKAAEDTPRDIMLTSFSILFARYKGNLEDQIKGVFLIEQLKDGDKILISEGCTHHRQCDDIGSVKIPQWLLQHTRKKLIFEISSGHNFPSDLETYSLVIHCGGCTLSRREMKNRLELVAEKKVPIVNYGIFIAYIKHTLDRSLQPFPFAKKIINSLK